MPRQFKMSCCDPLEAGRKVYKRRSFEIKPGITVLTGCNGAGKSTLIRIVMQNLKKENMLFRSYDNLRDGGSMAMQSSLDMGSMPMLASLMTSSEGESIKLNLLPLMKTLHDYACGPDIEKIMTKSDKIARIFHGEKEYAPNELWIMLDASDSGLSIDSVILIKGALHKILEKLTEQGIEAYILIAANEYEMCDGEDCFDVQSLSYKRYKSYAAYKRAILKSADWKEAQIENAIRKSEEKEKKHD